MYQTDSSNAPSLPSSLSGIRKKFDDTIVVFVSIAYCIVYREGGNAMLPSVRSIFLLRHMEGSTNPSIELKMAVSRLLLIENDVVCMRCLTESVDPALIM